jgi:hypothetical protein
VLAVLLQENSTNSSISYKSLLPEIFPWPDNSIRIVEYQKKLSLNPTSLPGLEARAVFGFVTFVPIISSSK